MHEEFISIVNAKKDEVRRFRQAIINFCTIARAAIISGSIAIKDLYNSYELMKPCLHIDFGNKNVIDLNAFSYAIQRLPKEISCAKKIYVKRSSEDLSKISGIKEIRCAARRRKMYEIDKGYIQIVTREGESDIFDIITSLIMYSKEASKIKKKLAGHPIVQDILNLTHIEESDEKNRLMCRLANHFSADYGYIRDIDQALNYELFEIINNIIMCDPEDIKIEFDRELSLTDVSNQPEL